jgi:hypothetical protein
MILVFGNYLKISSVACEGEIYGLLVIDISPKHLLPEYDSRIIFKNGYGNSGSSRERSIEGVKSLVERFKPIQIYY